MPRTTAYARTQRPCLSPSKWVFRAVSTDCGGDRFAYGRDVVCKFTSNVVQRTIDLCGKAATAVRDNEPPEEDRCPPRTYKKFKSRRRQRRLGTPRSDLVTPPSPRQGSTIGETRFAFHDGRELGTRAGHFKTQDIPWLEICSITVSTAAGVPFWHANAARNDFSS